MHPVLTMKHWSHELHDHMLTMRQGIDEHMHSRHFWMGVAVTLFIVAAIAMMFILAKNAPIIYPTEMPPYIPYGV